MPPRRGSGGRCDPGAHPSTSSSRVSGRTGRAPQAALERPGERDRRDRDGDRTEREPGQQLADVQRRRRRLVDQRRRISPNARAGGSSKPAISDEVAAVGEPACSSVSPVSIRETR